MQNKFSEDNIHLDIIIKKSNDYLSELDNKVKLYEEEFKEFKKYLWENRLDMDAMEVF